MTDEYDTQVAEILDEASGESKSFLTSEEAADDAGQDLMEVAGEADELVASSEPMELLKAVGLGTLPDGSEAESASEAIAKGDPERVEDLHRLLRLAKLGDRSDEETLEDATVGIRETVSQSQSGTDDTMTENTGQDGSPDEESTADNQDENPDQDETSDEESKAGDQESTADDENEAEAEEGNDEDDGGLGNRLREAMSSPFEEFGDEIGEIQEQLQKSTAADENDADEMEGTDREETDEESNADDEDDDGLLGLGDNDADDKEADDEDENDDGLLGLGGGDGDNGGGGLGSSDSSRHSTMAPPPSERADMHAVKRYSTMPRRNKQ
jgi:hypothetical protein